MKNYPVFGSFDTESGSSVSLDTELSPVSENPVQNKAIVAAITNPNLLDNPDFEINQKRFTEVSTGTTIIRFIDRWIASRLVVKKETHGISIAWDGKNQTSGFIFQKLEKKINAGTYITCQAKINGSVYSATHILPNEGNWVEKKLTTDISSELGMVNDEVWCQIKTYSTEPITIEWVKLELGSVATSFTPPHPATELVKCQRYFYAISFGSERFIGNGGSNGTGHVVLSLPTTMRIAPTISNSDGSETKLIIINGNTTISDVTITQVYQGQNNISVAINGTGIANGQVLCGYHQRTDDGSALPMYISAEL